MNITKIKSDDTRVEIHQASDPNAVEQAESKLNSKDEPMESFKIALQALGQDVWEICELGGDITVRGVSITYDEEKYSGGFTGAVITALRGLEYSNSPMVLNTPWMPSYQYSEDNDNPQLSKGTIDRIENLIREAELYLQGKRKIQQLGLFEAA